MNTISTRQYVAVKFKMNDGRLYTYHNDGPPVAVGDVVKVAARDGDGSQKVRVAEIVNNKPPFATKPIIGKFEGDGISGNGQGALS